MYSICGIENVFDLMAYTVAAMREVGYEDCDIEDYINESLKEDSNYGIIEFSKEKLEDCNRLARESSADGAEWFEDTWRDHYYSSLWDDDGRYKEEDDDNTEDTYDYLTGGKKSHNIWDDDNVIDDIETDDEKEAYEGFSSCKNHYWDCSEDDDYDDSNWKIKGYYECMRKEFDPSYDVEFDPWTEEDEKLDK